MKTVEKHEKINVPYCFSFVGWFKVGCMPTDGQAIVYVTTNNKIGILANANVESWDWHVRKYSIVGWCYSADLLPKF